MKYKKMSELLWTSLILVGISFLNGCNNTEKEVGSSVENTSVSSTVEKKGWYIRLRVATDTLKDNNTVFGYLQGASDNKDKYDSKALSSNGLYTTIYHEDFGNAREYRSDYRAYAKTGEKSDTWVIHVKSGDANADVTLSWDGITYVMEHSNGTLSEELHADAPELNRMRIIDLDTGEMVSATDNDRKISFNMNGEHEHTFKWILLKEDEAEPETAL